ncbi:MAG TPA: MCP four helix bundle domain-containing protein, partial [Nitrospira sp.]|nr:MCP four helix bundle domain-containing protein [Nitrospira sp.]
MSVFKNLTTVRKLMLAFGTVGAIMAGLGCFGINTVSTVNDMVAVLYERELKGLSAIKDVNLAITGISRLTRAAIISTDQKEKEQFSKTIVQLKQQFQDKLSEFQKLTITDEAKTISAELARIFPPYMELMEEAVRLTLRDDNVNAIKKVHDAISDAQQVMSKASELAVMKEKQAERVYKESNVLYERSRNIMVGLTIVGVGLGLMLGWVISQMIGRSLAHLGKVVSKLERGDLTARAAVESKDEVGQLAQSFNKMGEQLEHTVKNQEQVIASKVAEVKGITDAIDKSQAAIEFNMDGTIITANQNFLNCLGYTLDEIKGRHQRMFAEPAHAASTEYQAFWAKLNRGEFDAGVYRRVGKGGKEIWIQASYNPILDSNGKVYKVVNYATDIMAQKTAQVEMERLVAESQTVLSKLAANDLTQEMTEAYSGELKKIKDNINAVVQHLTETITTVRAAVEAVKDGSEEITRGNEDLSHRTSEQASALEETSASMEEMTSTVKQNAENAKQANQLAIAARETADKGGAVTK